MLRGNSLLTSMHPGVDNGQEADELLMAMMLHTLANDLTLKHIERGE